MIYSLRNISFLMNQHSPYNGRGYIIKGSRNQLNTGSSQHFFPTSVLITEIIHCEYICGYIYIYIRLSRYLNFCLHSFFPFNNNYIFSNICILLQYYSMGIVIVYLNVSSNQQFFYFNSIIYVI